ncbi:MAG: phage holin family protein [Candidatus Dormibacteria bacterium]
MAEPDLHERSVPELMKDLASETTTLMRKELELAKAEMADKGRRAGVGVGLFGAAGTLGMYAFGALTLCLIAALSHAVPLWLASLIVAVAYAAAAGIFAINGRQKLATATPAAPEETVESIKEDVQWARTRAEFGKR